VTDAVRKTPALASTHDFIRECTGAESYRQADPRLIPVFRQRIRPRGAPSATSFLLVAGASRSRFVVIFRTFISFIFWSYFHEHHRYPIARHAVLGHHLVVGGPPLR
jgi:hypothetical protein